MNYKRDSERPVRKNKGIAIFGNLKVMVCAALLRAISIVLGKYLAVNPTIFLRISFENLPILMAGMFFGPLIGGVVGAALLGAIYAAVVGSHLEAENPVITYAIICAVGALISMVGDLAASAIKRYHNIKDYGKLIPGHGGILDRFDSVIFTAPIIYYLALFL